MAHSIGFVKAEMKKRVTYKPSVQIRTTCQVISATCTCPAGGTPAFCKHVFALLHAINDYIIKKLYDGIVDYRLDSSRNQLKWFLKHQKKVANFEVLSVLSDLKKSVLTNITAVRYGLENEDYVRYTMQQRNPHYVVRKTGLAVHPIDQYIAASPDGLIRSGKDYMIMEIKCLYNPEGVILYKS
ncbi:SWIM-type domain-containing protein [Trichonephila clavipes]|uniref:SWIM-type domain-containing protein n=1 Tax=Trichonephila clavipes TaxID=2585209 RepID=A0A8X7BJM9_TRICX|nr:SWIM-type domain-containing protein [Trichonephila clavipes]